MAPPEQEQQQGGRQEGGGLGQSITGIIRMAVFWYFASKLFSTKGPATGGDPPLMASNLFHKSEPIDVWVYVESDLVWHQTDIPYGDWDTTRSVSLQYRPSEAVLSRNASVLAEVFFCKAGYSHDPADPEFVAEASFRATHPLITFLPKSKSGLLSDDDAAPEDLQDEDLRELEAQPHHQLGARLHQLPSQRPASQHRPLPDRGNYYPIVYFNDFWLLHDKLIPLNHSLSRLPLHLHLGPISITKWLL